MFFLTSKWMLFLVVIHREAPNECFVGLTLIAGVMMEAALARASQENLIRYHLLVRIMTDIFRKGKLPFRTRRAENEKAILSFSS